MRLKRVMVALIGSILLIVSFSCLKVALLNNNVDLVNSKTDVNQGDIVITYADITHNGMQEKITVDISNVIEKQEAILKIIDAENNIIWEERAGIPHVGWNSLFLYIKDGTVYLLRYNPYMNQGYGSYTYELFWIDEFWSVQTICSNTLDFSIKSREPSFNINMMISFVDEINGFLNQSILLFSTEGGELRYSTESSQIHRVEEFSWLYNCDIQYDEKDTLREKLEKYQEYIESEKYIIFRRREQSSTFGPISEAQLRDVANTGTLDDIRLSVTI